MTTQKQSAKPVFLLSCERSGSTLLRYILDTHSEICCPGELGLGVACAPLCNIIERTIGTSIRGPDAKRRIFASIETGRILSDIMTRYAQSKNKRIWCDKRPDNVHFLLDIEFAFEGAQYICLYRNCMDVVHSCLESGRFGFMRELASYVQEKPMNLVEAMIDSWVDKTTKVMEFEAEHSSRCFRIKYESIVFDSAGVLPPMFRFLGCDWEPNILERAFSVPHDMGGGDDKILATRRIEQTSVGLGSTIPLLQIPPDSLTKMNKLLRALDYPEVGQDWGKTPSPYRPKNFAPPHPAE